MDEEPLGFLSTYKTMDIDPNYIATQDFTIHYQKSYKTTLIFNCIQLYTKPQSQFLFCEGTAYFSC